MPTTRSRTRKANETHSPAWECESGDLPQDESPSTRPQTPSPHPSTRTPSPASTLSPESSPESKQARNARSTHWKAWQDRFLAAEALKHRPFLEARGKPIKAAWNRLAEEMRVDSGEKGVTIDRTGAACRARFKVIIDGHKVSLIVLFFIYFLTFPRKTRPGRCRRQERTKKLMSTLWYVYNNMEY